MFPRFSLKQYSNNNKISLEGVQDGYYNNYW
jgi:hypothetical protein